MNELVFKGQNDQALTNSLLVAEKFGKRHADVIRSIENLLNTSDFELNAKMRLAFVSSTYEDSTGKANPVYIMSRKGFSILVMGYTGVKALKFKSDFYDAFENMEKILKQQQKPLSQMEALLQSVQMLADQDKRLNHVEDKVLELDARITTRPDYFTIAGYARMKKIKCGLTLASSLGRKAAAICQSNGYPMEKTPDPRFGEVNTYPMSVLEEVFDMNIY